MLTRAGDRERRPEAAARIESYAAPARRASDALRRSGQLQRLSSTTQTADSPMPTRLMMASTLDTNTTSRQHDLSDEIVAVIDTAELEAARQDPRVRSFLTEADAYLTELEQQGRNR